MAGDTYVVIGLAHARSGWFRSVSRWANAASAPIEFVKCLSVEELRSRLESGRAFSALLVDGGVTGLDRDLFDASTDHGTAVVVVEDGRVERDWTGFGASAVLPSDFERADLIDALRHHAPAIGAVDRTPNADGALERRGFRGRLVAVTGTGGAGASTIATAVAQGTSDDPRYQNLVALADLCLDADLAMVHDARDVAPGLPELVELHRVGLPSPNEIRRLAFRTDRGHYHLLLGLRRHRDWIALRPRAFESSLEGMLRAYRLVVADVDADVEGEDETGVLEIGERNLLARTTIGRADVVLTVGTTGVKGLHGLVRTVHRLLDFGVDPMRIVPVVNRAPRSARSRSELTTAFADLLGRSRSSLAAPVYFGERRRVEQSVRDGTRLPAPLTRGAAGLVLALLEHAPAAERAVRTIEPTRIAPGSLGHFTTQGEPA